MKHLCGFYVSVDSATLSALGALVDEPLTRPAADRYSVPADLNVIAWAAACGVNMTRCQIQSPSLAVRRMTCDIVPFDRGQASFTVDGLRVFVPQAELALVPTENFMVYGSEDGAGATALYALVCLKAPGPNPAIPAGDIRRVRATATATLVANTWTTLTPTLEYDLEPGSYALVGFYAASASAIAARAIFTGQAYRPGVIATIGTASTGMDFNSPDFMDLIYEDLGHFTHVNVPQFQFLASAADTAETLELDLVKIG
jgi:hypothetical protein